MDAGIVVNYLFCSTSAVAVLEIVNFRRPFFFVVRFIRRSFVVRCSAFVRLFPIPRRPQPEHNDDDDRMTATARRCFDASTPCPRLLWMSRTRDDTDQHNDKNVKHVGWPWRRDVPIELLTRRATTGHGRPTSQGGQEGQRKNDGICNIDSFLVDVFGFCACTATTTW